MAQRPNDGGGGPAQSAVDAISGMAGPAPAYRPPAAPIIAGARPAPPTPWGNPDAPTYQNDFIVTVQDAYGHTFNVHRDVAARFVGFLNAAQAKGLKFTEVQSYNNRNIAGSGRKSNHAYGASIDLDPAQNPHVKNPKGGRHSLPDWVGELANRYGLIWGGDWNSSKDYMHFEAIGAPSTTAKPKYHQWTGALPQDVDLRGLPATAGRNGTPIPRPPTTSAPVTTSAPQVPPVAAPAPAVAGGGPGSGNPNAPAPAAAPLPANATDKEIKDFIRANFGAMAAFIDDPDIGPDLLIAARQGLVGSRLQNFLAETKWFKARTAKMRQWDVAYRQDRNTAEATIGETVRLITEEAQRIGVTVTPQRARDLAVKVNRIGWTPQQITASLANEFNYTAAAATTPGAATVTVDSLKSQARDWLVPVADKTLQDWTRRILAGTATAQDFTSYLRSMAKGLFPSEANAFDDTTPEVYFSPYAEAAARTLEINPEDVDFNDPKWAAALFQVGQDGKRRTMGLAEWQQHLRKTPDYLKTSGAREQASSMVMTLAERWGAV